ncbi:MAG: hypothetical protein Greene071436_181 [Parcubacteria group bacterium Greene0714_36]|nr:MAG: hypothetical protein Greene071436_181 [Parcubacteria group bacterium Greene0714_36]
MNVVLIDLEVYDIGMRYRELTQAILEHLIASGPVILDLLLPPHPRSRLARALLGLDTRRYSRPRPQAKHILSSTLYRLRKDGLIAKSGPNRKSQWIITPKGKTFLRATTQRKPTFPHLEYAALPPLDHIVRLVSFDIPEKQRQKRDWLRSELLQCEYRMLHRSVFIGNRPLPEELVKEIASLNLMRHLQIVSIDRKGTL